MVGYCSFDWGHNCISCDYDQCYRKFNGKGGDDVKAFFEEYGLVLVVTVIATGMILFSENFKATMQTTIESQWQKMTEQY